MKRKRFSVEQIVAVLKQAELGMAVSDVTRQMGISEQTFYRWKKQYAGLQSDQVRELKQLQDENTRLKKLVADLSLDVDESFGHCIDCLTLDDLCETPDDILEKYMNAIGLIRVRDYQSNSSLVKTSRSFNRT